MSAGAHRGASRCPAWGDAGSEARACKTHTRHAPHERAWAVRALAAALRCPHTLCVLRCRARPGGLLSAFATRMTGSPDLFAARWDGGLPGGLASGRRPAFSVNALEPPLAGSLLALAGGADDLERAEVVSRSLLLAMLVAQVGLCVLAPAQRWRGRPVGSSFALHVFADGSSSVLG